MNANIMAQNAGGNLADLSQISNLLSMYPHLAHAANPYNAMAPQPPFLPQGQPQFPHNAYQNIQQVNNRAPLPGQNALCPDQSAPRLSSENVAQLLGQAFQQVNTGIPQFPPTALGIQPMQGLGQRMPQLNINDPQQLLTQLLVACNPCSPAAALNQQDQASAVNLTLMQIVQHALQLNQPVGTCGDDEQRLIQALHDRQAKRQTKRVALDGLHGVNSHPALAWKDYYLEHSERLDRTVASLQHPPRFPTVEKSSISHASSGNAGRFAISHSSASSSRLPNHHNQRDRPLPSSFPSRHVESHRAHSEHRRRPEASSSDRHPEPHKTHGEHRRHVEKTKKRLAKKPPARRPVEDFVSLHPNHREIQIPGPPSRTPSPPLLDSVPKRSRKFTEEDRVFFIKFIQRKLVKDPHLKSAQLCAMLSEKAPYHSAAVWSSYWSRNHDLPDKILAAARKNATASQHDDHASSSSSDDEWSDSDSVSVSGDEADHCHGGLGAMPIADSHYDTEEDVRDMGYAGDLFNLADFRMIARHIASHPNWESMTRNEQWKPFADQHPRRSMESYAQGYGRYKYEITRYVRKFKRKAQKQKAQQSEPLLGPSRESPEAQEALPGSSSARKRRASSSDSSSEPNDKRPRAYLDAM